MENVAEAELVLCSEGSMCAVVTRDGVAPPGSKAISRTKSCRRNLGGPAGAVGVAKTRAGVGREAKPERPAVPCWKSDWLVVPRNPPKETRWWREGANVWGDGDAPGRDWTLRRTLPIPSGCRNGGAPARYPHEEPDAGKLHVRICEGESQQWLIYSTQVGGAMISPDGGSPRTVSATIFGCGEDLQREGTSSFIRLGPAADISCVGVCSKGLPSMAP